MKNVKKFFYSYYIFFKVIKTRIYLIGYYNKMNISMYYGYLKYQ